MGTTLPLIQYEKSYLTIERFLRTETSVIIETKGGRKIEITKKGVDDETLQDMLIDFQYQLEKTMDYIKTYGTEVAFNLDGLIAQYGVKYDDVQYTELVKDVLVITKNATIYAEYLDLENYEGIKIQTANGTVGFVGVPKQELKEVCERVKEQLENRDTERLTIVKLIDYKYEQTEM